MTAQSLPPCPGVRLNSGGRLNLCISCARLGDGATGTAPAERDTSGTWQCVNFVRLGALPEPARA